MFYRVRVCKKSSNSWSNCYPHLYLCPVVGPTMLYDIISCYSILYSTVQYLFSTSSYYRVLHYNSFCYVVWFRSIISCHHIVDWIKMYIYIISKIQKTYIFQCIYIHIYIIHHIQYPLKGKRFACFAWPHRVTQHLTPKKPRWSFQLKVTPGDWKASLLRWTARKKMQKV